MKVNLIFKKIVDEHNGKEGTIHVKIVEVDIPCKYALEGWTLDGYADTVEILPSDSKVCDDTNGKEEDAETYKELPIQRNFVTDIAGTAKLVRNNGTIKIVSRNRNGRVDNTTTPNSVCISDEVKNEFFKNCRKEYGEVSPNFYFTSSNPSMYAYYSAFMDSEYIRQRERVFK